jgi:hypothetical protein
MRALPVVAVLAVLASGARSQVIFGSGQTPPQQNAQQNNDPPGSVSGRVINAVTGEPVRGAMVGLQNFSRGGNSQSATTDGAGTFAAARLPPGDYFVQATHFNYQGILGLPGPSQMVTVASSQESSGVTLRLMPGGTISGKVLDDSGEPVSGCPLFVLGAGQGGNSAAYMQRGGASTNDKGEYKFDALTADHYLVYARCQESLPVERPLAVWRPELIDPAESWLPVYYPDSSSPEGAQRLTVLPGSELTGIDFRLKPTPVTAVSGTLSGVAPGAPGTQPNIMLLPADSMVQASLAYAASFDPATSTFKIQMVPPGSYRLVAFNSPQQMESLAYASLPITVGRAGHAPLFVQMHPSLALSGVVELPPPVGGGGNVIMLNSLQNPGRQTPKAPPLGYLNLIPLTQMPYSSPRQVEVHQDGSFTVQGLTPGRYKVVTQIWSPQPASLESVQFGTSQAIHGVIELTEGASGSLRVRMGASPPQVSASLADTPAGVGGQWMVFALPLDEPAAPFSQFMTGTGKSGDTVRLQNTMAGKFAFVAVEMTMAGGIQNERLSQLLRERVEPVEIVAGQDQTVSPKFFTSQEIEKLALAYLRGETR